jgi:hypothetical protein
MDAAVIGTHDVVDFVPQVRAAETGGKAEVQTDIGDGPAEWLLACNASDELSSSGGAKG